MLLIKLVNSTHPMLELLIPDSLTFKARAKMLWNKWVLFDVTSHSWKFFYWFGLIFRLSELLAQYQLLLMPRIPVSNFTRMVFITSRSAVQLDSITVCWLSVMTVMVLAKITGLLRIRGVLAGVTKATLRWPEINETTVVSLPLRLTQLFK